MPRDGAARVSWPVKVFARTVVKQPWAALASALGLIALAAYAIATNDDALKVDTSLESYRARGTPRTTRALAVVLAKRWSAATPLDLQSRRLARRRLLVTNASSSDGVAPPPAPPPLPPPLPPPPPPSPPFLGLPPTRRLASSLDRRILGLNAKSGVDGGTGADEFHVIVSRMDRKGDTPSDIANALRQVCVLKHNIEHAWGYEDACAEDRYGDGCAAAFSIFDIESMYRVVGLLDVFEGAQKLGRGTVEEVSARLDFIRDQCGYRTFTREIVEAAHRSMCDAVAACHKYPCNVTSSARCMIGEFKIGMCDFIERVDPTVGEVIAVAKMNKNLDAAACREIDTVAVWDTMLGIEVILRWSSSWDAIEAFGAPFGILLNDAFLPNAARGQGEPRRTAIVFRLSYNEQSTIWVKNVGRQVIEHFNSDISSVSMGTFASWRHTNAYNSMLDDRLAKDCVFAVGSLCVTVAFIALHTRSLSLAIGSMISIIGATLLTQATYYGVYRREWFGIIHIAGIFLSIGIGADDVFVIYDHWLQSANNVEEKESLHATLEERMRWTLHHSAFSISITSFTTAAAFASSIPSSIPPVRLFGTFMATQIIFLLLVSIVVTSSVLVLNEKWKRIAVSRNRVTPSQEEPVDVNPTVVARRGSAQRRATIDFGDFPENLSRVIHRRMSSAPLDPVALALRPSFAVEGRPLIDDTSSASTSPVLSPRRTSRRRRDLLAATFTRLVHWKWTLNAVFVAMIVGAVLLGLNIVKQTGDESLSLWPKGHVIHDYTLAAGSFNSSRYEESVLVQFTFGLDAARSSVSAISDKSLSYSGVPVWLVEPNASYDFSDEDSQIWLLEFCAELRSMRDRIVSPTTVNCWIYDLDIWLKDGGLLGAHIDGLPIARQDFRHAVRTFANHVNTYGLLRFIRNRDDCEKYRLGDDLCVAYSAITVPTSARRMSTADEIRKAHDFWETWFAAKILTGPLETRGAFQSSDTWVLADTVDELKSAASLTVVYSLVLAFLVLFLCTLSVKIAAAATFCIASVVVYFVAFMALRGWRLGIIESVCVQIIVGLSIDYISHIAVAYVSTHNQPMTKDERSLSALRTVGGAVAAGWFSSIAAALCLLGCTIVFFTKFATFIVVTLTASFVHAVFVLPVVLAALGPAYVQPPPR